MKNKPSTKSEYKKRRHARVRAVVCGTSERPRLVVHRSNRYVSAQIIDDIKGNTLAAAHGRDAKNPSAKGEQAKLVGAAIAKIAKASGISTVVFDRAGYRYNGQVKILADAARDGGLIF